MIPWDHCIIKFRLARPLDMHQFAPLTEELPPGWVVSHMEDAPGRRGWILSFDVQGEALERDGALVRRILRRMGVL